MSSKRDNAHVTIQVVRCILNIVTINAVANICGARTAVKITNVSPTIIAGTGANVRMGNVQQALSKSYRQPLAF